MRQKVRVTGILVENKRILLLEQKVTDSRQWSLPGGALEVGETMEQCMIREMKEETGLDIVVGDFYKPDLVILPVDGLLTMSPEEVVYATQNIGCKYVIPGHDFPNDIWA
jgi:8-oxo-dGTP pyrophosphatase MutT (NUDIX family)